MGDPPSWRGLRAMGKVVDGAGVLFAVFLAELWGCEFVPVMRRISEGPSFG